MGFFDYFDFFLNMCKQDDLSIFSVFGPRQNDPKFFVVCLCVVNICNICLRAGVFEGEGGSSGYVLF